MNVRFNGIKASVTLGVTLAGLMVGSMAFAELTQELGQDEMMPQDASMVVVPIPSQVVTGSNTVVTPDGQVVMQQAVRGTEGGQLQLTTEHNLQGVYQYADDKRIYFYGFYGDPDKAVGPTSASVSNNATSDNTTYNLNLSEWNGQGPVTFESGVRGIDPGQLQPVINYEIMKKTGIVGQAVQ